MYDLMQASQAQVQMPTTPTDLALLNRRQHAPRWTLRVNLVTEQRQLTRIAQVLLGIE
jgi:hypothetical protein